MGEISPWNISLSLGLKHPAPGKQQLNAPLNQLPPWLTKRIGSASHSVRHEISLGTFNYTGTNTISVGNLELVGAIVNVDGTTSEIDVKIGGLKYDAAASKYVGIVVGGTITTDGVVSGRLGFGNKDYNIYVEITPGFRDLGFLEAGIYDNGNSGSHPGYWSDTGFQYAPGESPFELFASGAVETVEELIEHYFGSDEPDISTLPPQFCFLAGTQVSRADGTPTNIEDVRIGDMVTAYDRDGNLVPGRVSAVHRNQVDHILDVHGLMVTPGHVTLCGDGPYANKHVPIIDILRTDGTLVREDGTKVRAATGSQLGDPDDHMVWAITGETQADGSTKVLDKGQIRLGTRVILSDGADVSVGELIARAGGQVNDKGFIVREAGGTNMPFVWVFGDRLPRPEDYVLQRSGLSLMDLYDSAGRPTSDLSMHQ